VKKWPQAEDLNMTQIDPETRAATGSRIAAEIGLPLPAEPQTAVQAALRDFVCSHVWSRPGLDRRARFIISIVGASAAAGPDWIVDGYIQGALDRGELSLLELREIALHMTGYTGFSQAVRLDEAITRVADALGLEPVPVLPLRAELCSFEQRVEEGVARISEVMVTQGLATETAFIEEGIHGYVFSELWTRGELDQRSRRWVTLTAAADTQAPRAVRSHAYSALASGDVTAEELFEFVLHYAIHGGHTRGSTMEALAHEMAEAVKQGQPFPAI
jgi:4-carboxymuconolactone decarboxylase